MAKIQTSYAKFTLIVLSIIIFINDLPNCVENGHITMYADDTSSSTRVNDVKDTETKVIPDLIKLCDWLKAGKLSLNALKLN